MTRGWKSMLLRTSLFAAAIAGAVLEAVGAPPAPSPPPTGTIYYQYGDGAGSSVGGVRADGGAKTLNVLPGFASMGLPVYGWVNPAGRKSGSNAILDRWFIYPGKTDTYDEVRRPDGSVLYSHLSGCDLFAVRSNPSNRSQLIALQLTDLYGAIKFTAASACWSNDPNDSSDSFVQCWATDIRDAYFEEEDGTTGYYNSDSVNCSFRLPITVAEIDDAWTSPDFVPLNPDIIGDAELDTMLVAPMAQAFRIDGQGLLSPGGDYKLRCVGNDLNRLELADTLFNTSVQLLWDGSSGAPTRMPRFQWSPDGATVAITDDSSIWIQPSDGSAGPTKVLASFTKGGTTHTFGAPVWSPDSKHLAVSHTSTRSGTVTGSWVARLSLVDRKSVDLVSPGGMPLRWVSDD